jgi:Mn2+/Fe2+ NRAMP family transporter
MIPVQKNKKRKSFSKLCHGIITGAAGNDPAGITTYSVVGASTGLSQLFLVPLSTVLLITIQSICARIGDVKKKGLASIIQERFGQKVTFLAMIFLILANLTTMGADFAAIGTAFAIIFPKINIIFILPLISLLVWYVVVFKSYQVLTKFLLLLALIFISYIISGFLAKPDWVLVLKNTFVPQIVFSYKFYWLAMVGFLGTTIAPYLFFWQVSEEVDDKPCVKDAKTEVKENAPGLIFSNLIAYFIIICTATVLFNRNISISSAHEVALALRPFLGANASLFFALGIVGAGLLALPVLASSTAYAVAETFKWKEGLTKNPSKARGFYTVLSSTFLVALAISLLKINPVKILFYSQVFSGMLAPFLLVLIMIIAGSRKIMGDYRNGFWSNFFGWLATLIMFLAALAVFIS